MEVKSIGKINFIDGIYIIKLEKEYAKGLKGLSGFSYAKIIWWFDGCDNEKDRGTLIENKSYKKGLDEIGVFALRSPERPNPIAVSNCGIYSIDEENGIIKTPYIDANDGSIVLDIKPYMPSIDRVENADVPEWCKHWPKSFEESSNFDWEAEFNF